MARPPELPLPSVPAEVGGVFPKAKIRAKPAGIDVVIPVYRGKSQTLSCIKSVLASQPRGVRCIVVEDASPEPDLVEELQGLARRSRVMLRRSKINCGFPTAANIGIREAGRRDVILLNSDTLVPRGWIERLAKAAYSAPDIGTATPLSNDATIFSYPRENGNPIPDEAATARLDRLAQRANARTVVDVPTAQGSAFIYDATASIRSGCCARTCLPKAMVRKTIFVCVRATSAGTILLFQGFSLVTPELPHSVTLGII
jgi:GT2 family glycosyltransferase